MFAKRLQWVDEDGDAVDDDEDGVDAFTGGGWSPPEAIPAAFPPFDLHRRQPANSLFMCF
jgi:hypothetical protein